MTEKTKEITEKFLKEVEEKEIISKQDMKILKNFMNGKPLK